MNKYDLVSIVRPTADDTVVESIHKSIADVISVVEEVFQNKVYGKRENLPTR